MGSMLTADSSPESPRMSCRYCRTMKRNPNRARNCTKIDKVPAARLRWAKTGGEQQGVAVQLPGGEADQDLTAGMAWRVNLLALAGLAAVGLVCAHRLGD